MSYINFSSVLNKESCSFHLLSEELHVWLIDADQTINKSPLFLEKNEGHSLTLSLFQRRSKNSQKYLYYLLSSYLRISPELLVIKKTKRGKPMLLSHPEISFSVSHTDNTLALVFARFPVGIDLEQKRPVKAQAIAQKFFTPHELEYLQHAKPDEVERFFYLWTAKEAALKAEGCGITEGLRKASTVIQHNQITGLELNGRFMNITPWFLKERYRSQVPIKRQEPFTRDPFLECHLIGAIASFVFPALIRWYDCRSVDSVPS